MLLEFPVWAYFLWGIAIIWLLAFLIYQRQEIVITLQEGSYMSIFENSISLDIRAFIKSRHPDGLASLSLLVASELEIPICYAGDLPRSISNDAPKLFDATFPINRELFKEDTKELPFVLCAKLQSGKALFVGFPLETCLPVDERMKSIKIGGIEMKSKKTKIKGNVSEKQLHQLLEKASQPIKKSGKEKS